MNAGDDDFGEFTEPLSLDDALVCLRPEDAPWAAYYLGVLSGFAETVAFPAGFESSAGNLNSSGVPDRNSPNFQIPAEVGVLSAFDEAQLIPFCRVRRSRPLVFESLARCGLGALLAYVSCDFRFSQRFLSYLKAQIGAFSAELVAVLNLKARRERVGVADAGGLAVVQLGHFQVPVREMRVLSQFDVAGLVEDLGLGSECAGGLEIVNDRQTIRLVGEF